jgi:uncharacterized lipoprotein
MENRMTKLRIVIVFMLSFLGGCAISPQAIVLNPSVTVERNNIGQGRSLNLTVVDKRSVKALGSRGGIYSETALVTIAGGPEEPIRQELVGAMSGYGFNVIDAANADIDLIIEIETLGYQTQGDKYPLLVKNNILLKAICNKENAEFVSRYSANKEEEVLTPPTANQNERMINGLVSKALSALIKDKKLLTFLK